MSIERKVYLCDVCRRVVAEVDDDGKLKIFTRHDHDYHETVLNIQNPPENQGLTKSKK